MDIEGRPRSSQAPRAPLRDASNRANIPRPCVRERHRVVSSSSLGKTNRLNEPTASGATSDPQVVPAGNRRVSAVIETQSNSKRNSAISTTSTASGKSGRKTHIGPWQLGKTLGKGSTGRVRLAKHAVTGQLAAIKIVSKKSAKMVQSQSIAAMDRSTEPGLWGQQTIPCAIEREVVIMKLMEHPNIIGLYDVWENRGELYLVLEHVEGGELYDYISTNGALEEIEAVLYFRQIVSALACCHSFNICHRDLKPENILLDGNRNIKLADFGMAALQPEGHWLTTSCGSPHYASPEIIYGLQYKGDKADIWSCGVILFAMLAGYLPFDGGDLRSTLNLVKIGEYVMPTGLSEEAQDLISRLLQLDPERRITIPEILEHPLLTKYKRHSLFVNLDVAESRTAPPLPKCSPNYATRPRDIDMEIVRSLRTLWHDVTIHQLVDNILNDKPNHEKLFYKALLKFRDEQAGKHNGQPLEHSASDHHHVSRPFQSIAQRRLRANNRGDGGVPAVPSISVPVGGPAQTESGAYEEPRSARTATSYDPYRSSNTPLFNPQAEFANVTVHRQGSNSITIPDSQAHTDNDHSQSSKDEPRGKSQKHLQPVTHSLTACSGGFKRSSLVSFQSQSSIESARRQKLRSSSVPRSAGYKRNVSFRNLRRAQANIAAGNGIQQTRSQYSLCRDISSELKSKQTNRMSSSPSLPTPPPPVRTRKPQGKAPELNIAKPRYSYQEWKDHARQVSLELGQICEEAFNRSSVSPASPSTDPSRSSRESSDSPPTSVSTPEIAATANSATRTEETKKPTESPTSYAARELTETRRRLVEHSNVAAADGMPGYLSDVIAHLDRLLATETSTYVSRSINGQESAVSAPKTRPGLPSLPPINEESDAGNNGVGAGDSQFHFSKPEEGNNRRRNTIRLVSPDSASTPSNIRPLSVHRTVLPTVPEHPSDFLSGTLLDDCNFEEVTTSSPLARRSTRRHIGTGAIDEDSDDKSPRSSELRSSGETRKWAWFKHVSHREDKEQTPPTPPAKDDIAKERVTSTSSQGRLVDSVLKPLETEARDQNNRLKSFAEKSRRFSKIFGKRKIRKDKPAHEIARGINDPDETMANLDSATQNDLLGSDEPDNDYTSGRRMSQNWLARLFHVKPATKVLALNVSKGRAKKEVTKILREWKKYGMENVRLDKETKILKARVGELNFLRLRPVEFSVEFFTVLEYGRHMNLSLIKLNQEQGATPSFNKVVDTLTVVMKQRNFLVEDSSRAKKMCKLLDLGN